MKNIPLFVFLTLLLACQSRMFNYGNQNDVSGWHFRICTDQTKASRVWFDVSSTTDHHRYKTKWTAQKNKFIMLPSSLRYRDDLTISIKTNGRKKARLCILYGDKVVDSMEVSGTESQHVSKKNRDDCPC